MPIKILHNFNEIYSEYYTKAFRFVISYVHDKMAAEDIVSDSLIKFWQKMKKEVVTPAEPFLFSILKNQTLDYLRHQEIVHNTHDRIKQKLNKELGVRISSLESTDPEEIFSEEIQNIVEETLQLLSPKTRDIFIMSRFSNKSHKEIAELYNISVKGVDYHISISIKALKIALQDYLPLIGLLYFRI